MVMLVVVMAIGCRASPPTPPRAVVSNRPCPFFKLVPTGANESAGLTLRGCDLLDCVDHGSIPGGHQPVLRISVREDCQRAVGVTTADGDPVTMQLWFFDVAAGRVVRSIDLGPLDPDLVVGDWHGARYQLGAYPPGRARVTIYESDGAFRTQVSGGNVWSRPDGRFLVITPANDMPNQQIGLFDVERSDAIVIGRNTGGTMDEVTWKDNEAVLWWRNGRSRRVPIPADRAR